MCCEAIFKYIPHQLKQGDKSLQTVWIWYRLKALEGCCETVGFAIPEGLSKWERWKIGIACFLWKSLHIYSIKSSLSFLHGFRVLPLNPKESNVSWLVARYYPSPMHWIKASYWTSSCTFLDNIFRNGLHYFCPRVKVKDSNWLTSWLCA